MASKEIVQLRYILTTGDTKMLYKMTLVDELGKEGWN